MVSVAQTHTWCRQWLGSETSALSGLYGYRRTIFRGVQNTNCVNRPESLCVFVKLNHVFLDIPCLVLFAMLPS